MGEDIEWKFGTPLEYAPNHFRISRVQVPDLLNFIVDALDSFFPDNLKKIYYKQARTTVAEKTILEKLHTNFPTPCACRLLKVHDVSANALLSLKNLKNSSL
ncbi:hypothetical protein HUJ05_013304 [Dendroctonus ponderosae]|nr:hypothetical protein HUJ05_013304 [Dendroctonus ponderosae]